MKTLCDEIGEAVDAEFLDHIGEEITALARQAYLERSRVDSTRGVLRVIGNNILVRPDPAPKRSGLIEFPGDAVEHGFTTGTVVAVGSVNGKRSPAYVPIPGIKVGDRVYYIRYLEKQDTNKQIMTLLDDNIVRMRASDVILVFDQEDLATIRPDLVAAP